MRAINPPTVTITTNANPIVGAPVVFTIASPAAANFITQAVIDFGDGTPPQPLGSIAPGGSVVTTHRYTQANSYTVRVTSTDSLGIQGTSTTVVTVQRVVPTMTISLSLTM